MFNRFLKMPSEASEGWYSDLQLRASSEGCDLRKKRDGAERAQCTRPRALGPLGALVGTSWALVGTSWANLGLMIISLRETGARGSSFNPLRGLFPRGGDYIKKKGAKPLSRGSDC